MTPPSASALAPWLCRYYVLRFTLEDCAAYRALEVLIIAVHLERLRNAVTVAPAALLHGINHAVAIAPDIDATMVFATIKNVRKSTEIDAQSVKRLILAIPKNRVECDLKRVW